MKARMVQFKLPVKGYAVGICIDGSKLPSDIDAHAHIEGTQPKWAIGYICAQNLKALKRALTHELAHLAANDGHGEPWRREMRRLGARIPASHRKKPRNS